MSQSWQAYQGARIFDGQRWWEGHSLVISANQVQSIVADEALPAGVRRHQLSGGLLVPGLIDVHVNGGGGVLFNDHPEAAALGKIVEAHRPYGTTAMMPTLITDLDPVMEQAIAAVAQATAEGMPGVLGLHLEGPYLNSARKGVHDEQRIRPMPAQMLEPICQLAGQTKVMLTLAPECVPMAWISQLAAAGVRVCAGHSAASYAQMQQAFTAGVVGVTHLFNAMSPLQSREPGVVGAALEDEQSWCGLIVDGLHVHPATMRVALRAKPQGKVMLVTDAVHTVGAVGEDFNLMGKAIKRINGKVATLDGVLAGSDLNMIQGVRNCVEMLQLDLAEALRMGSLYPAQFLGLTEYGWLGQGSRADFLWLSDALQVQASWIGGEAEYYR